MKITTISIAALVAAFIVPAAAIADDSIANLEMQTKTDRSQTRTYEATQTRTSHKKAHVARTEHSATAAVYTEHRGLGEPQHLRSQHVSIGNGGNFSFDVPAD